MDSKIVLGRIFAYMRISTKEEKGKQRFTRQEQAIDRWSRENHVIISERRIYKDDASGKSFDRKPVESHLTERHGRNWNQMCRPGTRLCLRISAGLQGSMRTASENTWN